VGLNNTQLYTSLSSKESGSQTSLTVGISYGPYENMEAIKRDDLLWKKMPPTPENCYGRVFDVGKIIDDGLQIVILKHIDFETDAEYNTELSRLGALDFQPY
jgi:hypothetical protein